MILVKWYSHFEILLQVVDCNPRPVLYIYTTRCNIEQCQLNTDFRASDIIFYTNDKIPF